MNAKQDNLLYSYFRDGGSGTVVQDFYFKAAK
jgi:hypothetical protein